MNLTRRETLKGVAVLAAAEKVTDGGLAPLKPWVAPVRKTSVLPPGAGDRAAFARACVACGLCVKACGEKVLKPSLSLRDFGQPVMDYREGYCLLGCVACSKVCPVGALEPLSRLMKPNVHLGVAVWKKDLCVRTTEDDECTACERKCPVRAIHIVKGFPVVDETVCIGCGACEHVCPSRPEPAIHVEGFARQRIVRPQGAADLLAEMRHLVTSGAALVAARQGVIVLRKTGRGLKPLVETYAGEREKLRGSIVFDKIVGRAAAAFYLQAQTVEVHAFVMSAAAHAMLTKAGIRAVADQVVRQIDNRERTGTCPMDAAVANADDPAEMVRILVKKAE